MTDYFPHEKETPASPSVPHSREAEEAVVGAVLINPDVYYDIAAFLKGDDFYIHRNKWMWEAIEKLKEKRTDIDLLTVSNELEKSGKLSEIGGSAYITSLINQVPTSLNAESYARIVKEYSIRRGLINSANEIASLAYKEQDIEKIKSGAYDSVEKAISYSVSSEMKPAKQLMSEFYDHVDELSRLEEDQDPRIKTGFIDLDKLLTINNGDLITVAGRPGMGKSGFATSVALYNVIEKNKSVAIFSLEMSDLQNSSRLISQLENLDLQKVQKGKLEQHEWPRFTHAVEQIANSNLFINENPDLTVPQIRALSKKIKSRHGLDLIIIDYLGLIEGVGENRTQEVSYISRNLKKMARALNVPVLSLHQMNREIEKRGDGKPQLSDLRDSGSIEQDSDSVLFFYGKGEVSAINHTRPVKASLAKQRQGPADKTIDLIIHEKTTKFDNAATVHQRSNQR
ncbi:MAG TPA: replicative DNA helicase [Anaerolineae bacterium]|nr:replicative DNA helicase [Anaerolineae bacterium]